MKVIENNFDNAEVNHLLTKHFIELRSVSPDDSCHVLDIKGLKDSSIKFWSFWDNNQLIGCAALKFLEDKHGEFKSIRVEDNSRGKGVGKKIISHLIEVAKNEGIKRLSIETGAGDFFKSARKLFKKFGFKTCRPFADYKEDPNSCYFDLEI